MSLTQQQTADIIDAYLHQGLSTYVIAEKYKTYPNKIRRILLRNNVPLKDKSSAQKGALACGRSTHPTKGTKRSESTKIKISEKVHSHWKKLSKKEYKKRVDKAKEQWYNMSEGDREALRQAATLAVREASKTGSKLELFLNRELKKAGYEVLFHKQGLVANVDLEIDLFLPALRVAIEIDGPSHFLPIWGEEKLQKHVHADADKAGLLLNAGMVVIRIKHLTKNLSAKYQRDTLKAVVEVLQKIQTKFPSKTKRYIELEI